ncbi:M60 family metallopeptidase [Niabella pedocola]|uniref:M60 family metallopeptidase n=1 Tax=Niabella pedocola TaxID=1752077 RepID=A0ABS8PTK4_9BACT|nr:M60 family metallopeptidase [Niabella pedocola]MCD2424393.1 M60 family metallopeptidase [Niabella pedocola]
MPPDTNQVLATYPLSYDSQVIAYHNVDPSKEIYVPGIITGRYGKGRVLVVGGNAYLEPPLIQDPDIIRFWKNVFDWSGASGAKAGFEEPGFERLVTIAHTMNISAGSLDLQRLSDNKVIFVTNEPADHSSVQKLDAFVRDGGTLVYVSSLFEYNKKSDDYIFATKMDSLLLKAGLYHLANPIHSGSTDDTLRIAAVPKYLIVDSILSNLANYRYYDLFYHKGAEVVPLTILKLIFFMAPRDAKAYQDLCKLIEDPVNKYSDTASLKKPLVTAYWPDLFKYLNRVNRDYRAYEKDSTYKATTNGEFPGTVPDNALRITRKLRIKFSNKWSGLPEPDSSFRRLYSTGLYVAPGDMVTVTLSDIKDTSRRLMAQIGIHDDNVSDANEYYRNPFNLVRTFNLDKKALVIHSLYGGLLYFGIPVTDKGSVLNVAVTGAVEAPFFQLGKTTDKQWLQKLRQNPAPWAELATGKIILTVPSDSIRKLEHPQKLMQFWDEVMDANADLAFISKDRPHPERIIIDNNVKWGAMYTVPSKIVAPNDRSLTRILNVQQLRDSGSWGHFHELGHRHQFDGLDFDDLGEVTVNLYTLYVYQTILGKDLYHARDGSPRDSILKAIKAYIAAPDYETWKRDPFLQLFTLYYPIIDAFGWEAIRKLNRPLRKLYNEQYGGRSLTPLYKKTDDERRDQYFVLLSKAIGKNLSEYFERLKIPVSDYSKHQVTGLPIWIPDIFKR